MEEMDEDEAWREVMRWLDGGGEWTESERGDMLNAVINLVMETRRVSTGE